MMGSIPSSLGKKLTKVLCSNEGTQYTLASYRQERCQRIAVDIMNDTVVLFLLEGKLPLCFSLGQIHPPPLSFYQMELTSYSEEGEAQRHRDGARCLDCIHLWLQP